MRLEFVDIVDMTQREPDVIETLHEPPPRVVVDLERQDNISVANLSGDQIDGDLRLRIGLDRRLQRFNVGFVDQDGQQTTLQRVSPENVREPG